MPIAAPSSGAATAAKSVKGSTSSVSRTGGIKSAIKASSGENANQNNETTETANNGDTNTYSGKTTSEVSTERRASAALGRFQEALKNSSIHSSGGGSASGGGGGGSAGGFDLGGGSSGGEEASSAAWGGAGANKAGEYGGGGAATASRGGGCSGGSCGGGSQTQQSNSPQQSQGSGSNGVSRTLDPGSNGGAAQLVTAMQQAGDKPLLVKFGADWCGPCNSYDSLNGISSGGKKTDIKGATLFDKGEHAILKVNVDENKTLAGQIGVNASSIPAFGYVFRKKDGSLGVAQSLDAAKQNHTKASDVERPQENRPEQNNSPGSTEPKRSETPSPEQSNPEPSDQQTQSQEHQLELRPVDQRLEITPDKPETADTQQLGICSNGSCSPYTVDFKAENINNEIQRFSDAVSGKDSSSLGIQDFNASNTDPADQEMLAKLGTLISSDMPNENKVASFKEQVSGYQKRHNPAM